MKSFLQNILLFSLPIIVLMIIGVVFLPQTTNDYQVKRAYLDANSSTIECIILGSSHSYYDIDPQLLSNKSFNAAYVSQTIDLDAAILQKYQNKWNHLKVIVIPIDYFTLFEQLGTGMESWRLKNYIDYWGIEQQARKSGYWKQLDILFDINKNRVKQYISKESDSITCSPFGWGNIYLANIKLDLVKEGKIAAARHMLSDTNCFSKNVEIVHHIIAFAKSNNTRVLFYTAPAYKTYTTLLDSSQLNKTYRTIHAIIAKEKNCFYANFLTDPDFSATDFHDADHLNTLGSRKFSFKIDSLTKKACLEPVF